MKKHKIYLIVSLVFILTQILPFFNLFVPIPSVLRYPIFLTISFIMYPDLLKKKSIIAQFIYVIVAFFFFAFGNSFYGSIGTVTTPLLLMTAGLVIMEYTLKYDYDFKYTLSIVFAVLSCNLIMTILSYPQILEFPNIIRYAFSVEYKDMYASQIPWLIQYATCHGLPILLAPLSFLCKKLLHKNKILFWVFLVITLVLFYIVYLSNATTALILSGLMMILGFFFDYDKLSQQNIIGLVAIGLLGLVLTSKTVMVPILDSVQGLMDDSWSNYHKIDELRRNLVTGESEGDLGEREEMYTTSLMLFIESPIIGTSQPNRLSHHSFFIDRLACLGMIFVIPLIMVFVYNFKSVYKRLIHTKIVYIYGFCGWMLMLILKNDFGQGSWLYGFAFLPLLCRFIDYWIDNNYKIFKKKK